MSSKTGERPQIGVFVQRERAAGVNQHQLNHPHEADLRKRSPPRSCRSDH
jgi:hypothetical protein